MREECDDFSVQTVILEMSRPFLVTKPANSDWAMQQIMANIMTVLAD
jgi:hypothetical protein